MKPDKNNERMAPPINDDFYAESYELRKAASTMTEAAVDWFRQEASGLLGRNDSSSESRSFSVLSIGSGEGDIDLELIKTLISQFDSCYNDLTYVALEPNHIHRKRFLHRLEAASFDKRVSIAVQDQRFEEFNLPENEPKFDLVLLVHVLYYFDDPYQIIQKALALTKEGCQGGQVIIVHQTAVGIPEIQRKHMRDVKGNEDEMFTTADIKTLLDRAEHRYQYYELDAHLEVTECLRWTDVGKDVASFCMECDLRTLHPASLGQILQTFWHLAEFHEDGRAFIREPIGIFVVDSSDTANRVEKALGDNDPIEELDHVSAPYGSLDWSGHALEPDRAEIEGLLDTAVKYILQQQANIEKMPLAGSGVDWLYTSEVSAETDAAIELAQSVTEPIPEYGTSDFDGLLHNLFEELAPKSTNDNSAGYLAFIPGGGLFHAVLADFIAKSLNRYVTIFMAAPGLAAIENQAIRWLCDIIGFQQGAGGVFTSGGATANFVAVHTARMNRLSSTSDGKYWQGTAYVSEQSHFSIEQGLMLCGFPPENIRKIPSNAHDFRICLPILRETIEQDKAKGFKPFLLVGMAGTTNTGSVDDLSSLAQIAQDHDMWFHVDAAYGGFFRLTKSGHIRLRGIEQADSVTLDPHKTMFLPYGTGSLLVQDRQTLKDAFRFTGAYMQPESRAELSMPDDIMNLSLELTRDFRGLRVWLPLKMLGLNPFRAQLEEKLALARWLSNQLSLIPNIRIVSEPQLSILAFKLEPEGHEISPEKRDEMNKILLKEINKRGNILLSPLRSLHNVAGEFCIRMAIVSFRTHRDRLEIGLRDIQDGVTVIMKRIHQYENASAVASHRP